MKKELTNKQEELIEEEGLEKNRNKKNKSPRRLRNVRKIGCSYYIRLTPSDRIDFNILKKDIINKNILIDISDIIVTKNKNK